MQICTDIYLEILYLSDVKTSWNMLHVNRKFYKETVFENYMQRKYPLLKNNNVYWKDFYLHTVNYLLKLEKKGIPYIPHVDFQPKLLYESNKILHFKAMKLALSIYNIEIMKNLLLNHTYDYNWILYQSAEYGFLPGVQYAIKKGAKNFNVGLYYAAKGGSLEIVKFIHKKDNIDNKSIFISKDIARSYGFLYIVEYLEKYF